MKTTLKQNYKYLFLCFVFLFSVKVYAQQTIQVDDNTQLEVNNNTVKIDTTQTQNSTVKIPNISTNTSLVTITSPLNGETISNTQLTIVGKSPAGVIVDVTLTYTEPTNIFNQNAQKTYLGTVTSDQSGSWAYVPAKNVPEGKYQVYASFEDSEGTINNSETITLYVTSSGNNLLLILIGTIVFAVAFLIFLLIKKLRTLNLQPRVVDVKASPKQTFIVESEDNFLEPKLNENAQPVKVLRAKEDNSKENVNLGIETEINPEYTKNTAQKILELLKNNPHLTRNDLAESLGITADGVKYNLKNLEDEGKLVHEGSKKTGYWVVKE